MKEHKYIVVDNGMAEVIIVFNEFLQHRDFVESFPKIVSAGFISLTEEGWKCWGKSVSLGCPSREIDSKIANRQLP